MTIKEIKELGYPLNLACEIFRSNTDKTKEIIESIPDFNGSLEYALYLLPSEKKDIIQKRFVEFMTYREIGELLNLSGTRIEQIIRKITFKLYFSKYVRYGVSGVIKQVEHYFQNEISNLDDESSELKSKYIDLENRFIKLCNLHPDELCDIIEDPDALNKYTPTFIEDLGLSARSYNALKGIGVDTLLELSRLSYDKLANTRNIGRISIQEINDKIGKYGYEIKE